MPISSNSIFHFTGSKNNLLSILRGLFKPYYSIETYVLGDERIKFAIPMVCFSDIPLSQVKNHIKIYGGYGIGMNREWGIKKELNPVLYLESNSKLATNLYKSIEFLFSDEVYHDNDNFNSADHFYEILRYIKNYKGNFVYRGNTVKKDYKYYDEKEWRYVPEGLNSQYNVTGSTEEQKKKLNEETNFSNHKLHFTPDDIRYLIVKSESEIENLISELKEIKSPFEENQIEVLISKVITTEQIFEDF